MNKVKLAFAGSVTLIMLLGVSNLWLFTTVTSLQANKTALTSQINDSQTQLNAKNNQIQTLQIQISNLSDRIEELEAQLQSKLTQINALNESYTKLQRQYEGLLFHYNLLNGPTSNFTTIQDLQITLRTHRTTYYYKDPLSGNVTMTYLNGTQFEGSFDLFVTLIGGGRSGARFYIKNGFADFVYGPPAFIYGPGTYSVKIGWIFTIDGFVVADPNDAGLPEVHVEVK